MDRSRKAAEALGFRALREHPESLQALLDTIACGILTVDRKGQINYSNHSARRLLGKSREELVGVPLEECGWNLLRPDGSPVPPEESPFCRVLRGEESVQGEVFALDHADGGRVFFAVNMVPLRDRRGRLCGAAADFVDITEKTKSQRERDGLTEALRRSESRFRTFAEAAPVAVFECDGEGCWLYLNPRLVEISGRSV
jgi:PAS domain S-box-containing protein